MNNPTPTDRSEMEKAERKYADYSMSDLHNILEDYANVMRFGADKALVSGSKADLREGVVLRLINFIQDVVDSELAAARREAFNKAIDLFGTHEEGFGSYCDTGDDMEWSCRSECTAHGIERVRKYMADFLAGESGEV